MLLIKGKVSYRNLNTTYTNLDQFLAGLQKEHFTGYCLLSFWEYEAVLFLSDGNILNGRETIGIAPNTTIRHGEPAVAAILKKGREKGGELNAHTLTEDRVTLLASALDATSKYENLSTDLTTLDKVIALAEKDVLSGYIEVTFENKGGVANLFLVDGELGETIFASADQGFLAEPISVKEVLERCQSQGAVLHVYQAPAMSAKVQGQGRFLREPVPADALRLFETIIGQFETVIDALLKPGTFENELKKMLPRFADKHAFLDPFLGDFRYTNHTIAYTGDASYKEFLDGLSDLLNSILAACAERIPKTTLFPRIALAFEPLVLIHAGQIERLHLEHRMPDLFQDHQYLKDQESNEPPTDKTQARSILNLQGLGVPNIGTESILREFYRVITLIAKKYVAADGQAFQYANFKKSPDYQHYQTATALLQNLDVAALKSRDDALAFWLNLYNFLVIDGVLKAGIAASVQDSPGFFAKTSYRLGEYVFSLDEIEHGILRNNQRRPYAVSRPFSGADPRKAFDLVPMDLRVHACLVNATKSAPAFTVYTPNQLESQLTQATQRFVGSPRHLRFDREKHELWLNRKFYWYHKDFAPLETTLIDFLLAALTDPQQKAVIAQQRSQLTLRFMDYDWGLNAA